MKHFLLSSWHFLEKLMLPYYCIMCLEISDQRRDLCCQCQKDLPILVNTCAQCGITISTSHHVSRCGPCITHPPHFDHALVGFDYRTPIDGWLRQFKFHKKGLYARILTEIYAEKLVRIFVQHPEQKPQILIPMPLHWQRLTQRGFNQAYIIARYLSHRLKIPILKPSFVTRVKYTQAQSSLNVAARTHNVRGAFSVQMLVKINHVAIIDDIITTGNTMNELSKQLKLAGIQRVSIWAIARVN
ncbi:MAG: ComF family protein [Pseudomonadota bacterium]